MIEGLDSEGTMKRTQNAAAILRVSHVFSRKCESVFQPFGSFIISLIPRRFKVARSSSLLASSDCLRFKATEH